MVTRARQLNDTGKDISLVLVIKLDGAKTTSNLCQKIVAFKVSGVGAIFPLANGIVKPQTRSVCWTVRIALCIETTSASANHINPIFNWWDRHYDADEEDQEENENFHALKPFRICYTNGMPTYWKLTKKVGCSKTKRVF